MSLKKRLADLKDRNMTSAQAIQYYSELIYEERRRIAECLVMINEYSDRLRRVTSDTVDQLMPRQDE